LFTQQKFENLKVTKKRTYNAVLILASTLYGPMHTKSGVQEYVDALTEIKKNGGKIAFGGKVCIVVFFFLHIIFTLRCSGDIHCYIL